MNRPLRRLLATILSAAVLVTSPGLPAARAVAAGFVAPRSAAAAPRLRTVVGGMDMGAYAGRSLAGVDLHGALSALRAADLATPAGLRLAAPVLARLPEGRPADEPAVVSAVLAAASELEARALALAAEAPKAIGSGEGLIALDRRLAELDGFDAFLSPTTRITLAGARGSVASAAAELKAEAARGVVRRETAGWRERRDEAAAVAGRERIAASGLTRRAIVAAVEARERDRAAARRFIDDAVAGRRRADSTPRRETFLGKAAWPLALGMTAVIGWGLASASLGATAVLATAGLLAASVLAHEWAHLLVLRGLGDDTARLHGVGLNPFKQMDPWGTVLMPVLSVAATLPFLGLPIAAGWAKAVPVDFNKLPNPKLDAAKVALAGPAANLLLAGAAFAALSFVPVGGALAVALAIAWKANLALAVFNLLPLPQLDGGKIAVALMPQALYERWTASPNLPAGYQKSYTRLYEGPARLLTWFGLNDLGRTNRVTRLITMGAMAAFFVGATVFFKLPLLLLLLVCSYDYYCVREKIQNEDAVQDLIVILQGFAGELAALAASDPLVNSEVDVEEAEHALKNALEDTIDKVVDFDGFDALDADAKWARLKDAYLAAAVASLKAKTMAADDEATIRRLLDSPQGRAYLEKIKGWVDRWEVFAKWHSPARKGKGRDALRDAMKGKPGAKGAGGATLAAFAVGALGASLAGDLGTGVALGLAALGMGALAPENARKSFLETLDEPELKIAPKEKQFLSLMLTEMKQQDKPPVIGRIAELHEVVKTVTAPRGVINSVVLVGKAGTGKTAVVEKLAQALALSDGEGSPETFGLTSMRGKFLVKLNLPRLLQQEQPAQALDALLSVLSRLNDADKRKGSRVVLFVDEIHQLFEHPQGALMANALKEPLRDGEVTIVAATTEAEYKKYMENDEAFRRRLIKVSVPESSTEESLRALRGAKTWYEHLYGMTLPDETLQAAAELSKYDQEVFLPGRAFLYVTLAANNASFGAQRDRLAMAIADRIGDLRYEAGRLSQALAGSSLVTQKLKDDEPGAIDLYNRVVALTRELVELYAKRDGVPADGTPEVTSDMVKEEIARRTGVASGQLSLGREPMEKYLEMEARVGNRVVGQNEAVAAIAAAVRQNKAGLSDPNRPMGTFYLTGPTGVGKTHLAKELARFLFDDPEAVTRLDMSEYMESHQVARLIGAPPGYVGYGQGGQLTEAVRKRPYGVLLLDEIEKAHSDVWLMLLQITGDGRLTDGEGRTVSFKNTIILMTSNLGMALVDTRPFEEEYKALKAALDAAQDGPAREIVKAKMRELSGRLAAATKQQAQTITDEAFRATYPPEFAGRLSAPPIVFNRIDPDMAAKIVDLKLAELRGILAHAGHELTWSPAAVEALVHEGFSITLGARPLANAIDRLITQPLAAEILKSYASGAPGPRAITVGAEAGRLSMALSPITPKAVSKTTVEGAASEVFSRVLDAALKAASSSTAPELALEAVDAWAREAVAALGGVATTPAAPASAAAPTAPAKRGVFAPDALPELPSAAGRATAAHNEPGRKDPALAAGHAEAAKLVADQAEPVTAPWNEFVKLFGEQAKRMSPQGAAPVELAFGRGTTAAVATVTRRGALGDKEKLLLKTHFGGPVPVDAAQARDKAEALNVMGQDGRRVFFDLHRLLAVLPGARLGWKEAGGTVTYWLELPLASAAPVPAAPVPAADAAPADAPTAELPAKLRFRPDLPATEIVVRVVPMLDAQNYWDVLVRRLRLPASWRGQASPTGEAVVRAATPRAAARFAALLAGDSMVASVEASERVERLLRAAPAAPEEAPPDEAPPVAAAPADATEPLLTADFRVESAHPKIWGVPHDYMAGPPAPETVWFRLDPSLSAEAREAAAVELAARAGLRREAHAGPAHHVLVLGQDGRSAMRGALVLAEDDRVVEVVIDEPAVPLLAEVLAQPELPLPASPASPKLSLANNLRAGTLVVMLDGTPLGDTALLERLPAGAVLRREQPNLFYVDFRDPVTGAGSARALATFEQVRSVMVPVELGAALGLSAEPPAPSAPAPAETRLGKFRFDAGLEPGAVDIRFGMPQTVTVINTLMRNHQVPDGSVRRRGDGRFLVLEVGEPGLARRIALAFSRDARVSEVRVHPAHRAPLSRALPPDTVGIARVERLDAAPEWVMAEGRRVGAGVTWRAARSLLGAALRRAGLSAEDLERVEALLEPLSALPVTAVGWTVADGAVRVRLSGAAAEPVVSALEDPRALELLAALNGRAVWTPGQGVWLDLRPRLTPPAAAATSAAAPEAFPEWRPGEGARGRVVEFARALLAQGDARGQTLRLSAAETLAALSTRDDLDAARAWTAQRDVARRHPEIVAGALTVARHGRSRGDLDLLKGAAYRLDGSAFNGHQYNAAKARVAEAVARLLGRADPSGRSRLPDLYRAESEKEAAPYTMGNRTDESSFGTHRSPVLLEAYYEAMARYGDEDATDLLLQEWTQRRLPLLYEHLARVAPERLDAALERGRRLRASDRVPDGPDRLLYLYALAERGTVEEARHFVSMVQTGWQGTLDGQTKPMAGEALARAAARGPRAAAAILPAVRPWLRETLSDGVSFARVTAAVQAVGAAGAAEDLPALERIVRFDPGAVSYEHEMTQHEAALAWARLVVRAGLARDLLTRAREPGALPPLLAMLADRSAVVNKAALETLKLLLGPAEEARAPRPELDAPPASAALRPTARREPDGRLHGRPSAAVDAMGETVMSFETLAGLRSPGYEPAARLTEGQRALYWSLSQSLSEALASLTGAPFGRLRLNIRGDAEAFTWSVREALPRSFEPDIVARVREALGLMLYWSTPAGRPRPEQVTELESRVPGTRVIVETLTRVLAEGGRLGVDHAPGRADPMRGELEVWWTTDAPPPPVR